MKWISFVARFQLQEVEIEIAPDLSCRDCTIRLVRQALEWNNYRFHSCADVDIVDVVVSIQYRVFHLLRDLGLGWILGIPRPAQFCLWEFGRSGLAARQHGRTCKSKSTQPRSQSMRHTTKRKSITALLLLGNISGKVSHSLIHGRQKHSIQK